MGEGNHYRGKVCAKHPEFDGERYRGECVRCRRDAKNAYRKRKYVPRPRTRKLDWDDPVARGAYNREWRMLNPDDAGARRAYDRERRALRAAQLPESDRRKRARARDELSAKWKLQRGRCGLTGAMIPEGVRPHIDHIVPRSAGGPSTIDNLHFTHPMANYAKNGSSVEEFRAWLLGAADALREKMKLESLC